jgi:hypothetical protein
MRSTLITIAVVASLAASAGTASARPADLPVARSTSSRSHAVATPTPGQQHRYLGSYLQAVPSSPSPAPAPVVRVAAAPNEDGGVDWAGIGIGGGLAAALLLAAAGVSASRRPSMRVR